jgi:hypothetical protein
LSPGATLQVTFTSAANTSDLLFFFNTDPLTVTGSPVITTQLYNGSTLLGTITTPPPLVGGQPGYVAIFRTSGSLFNIPVNFITTADLTSMKNGTIQGTIIVTVSGGTISGFDTSHFILYDGASVGSNSYAGKGDLTSTSVTITAPTTVPAVSEWGLVLLTLALGAAGTWATRTRAA